MTFFCCVGQSVHVSVLSRQSARPSEGVDERVGIEVDQVVGPLAEAHQLDRQAELALDRDDDAALGRAVELGQHDARSRRPPR